jgi:RNA polymerase sigma factor (sigma-70 family)
MKDFDAFLNENMRTINYYCAYNSHKFNIDKKELKSTVLEKLWKSRHIFTEQQGTKAWLSLVIKNCCLDYKRTIYSKQAFCSLEPIHSTILDASHKKSQRNYIAGLYIKIRNQYPGQKGLKYRTCIYMIGQGYKIKEVAEQLNISENSVKTIVFRIREFLHDGETINI